MRPQHARTLTHSPTDTLSHSLYSLLSRVQKPKLTLAQKRLEKVDKTGMKSISAFFSAKPKKKK